MLALDVAARDHRRLPEPCRAARERAAEVVRREDDLRRAAADDRVEGFRAEHAPLAVNIAMYVLCSNYKDDQVHAPFLMRKRSLAPALLP